MFLWDKFGALPKIPCLGSSAFPLTEREGETEIEKTDSKPRKRQADIGKEKQGKS